MQNVPYAIAVSLACVHLCLSTCVKLAKDITKQFSPLYCPNTNCTAWQYSCGIRVITNTSSCVILQLRVQDRKQEGGGLSLFKP